jgi:phage-related protein
MDDDEKKLNVLFFRTDKGNEPVREWLLSLDKHERKIIGDDVLKVQYCWPIGRPLVGNLGKGVWEVRSRLGDRIARVVFCIEGRWCYCTGSSRKRKKYRRMNLNSL